MSEESREAFLVEMTVIGQDLGEAPSPHHVHRYAVSQAMMVTPFDEMPRRIASDSRFVTRDSMGMGEALAAYAHSRMVKPSCVKWLSCVRISVMPCCCMVCIVMQSVRLYPLSRRAS